MKMKKWIIAVVIFTLSLNTAGGVTAFTLTNNGESNNADGTNMAGEVSHGIPAHEEWLSNYKPTQDPVTSIDDIDPNVCNLVHNINACSPEELEVFGALTDETGEGVETEPGSGVGGNPEPLFVDVEPGYTVQSLDEAVREDCSLAGGTVYVTFEGELGCEVAHDLEDKGDELVTSSQPPAVEPLPVPAAR